MEKKTKKSGRESAWNSRIATFPKEIDIETYLHLSQKEYELRAERYAERGVNLVNATINFHFRFDWIRHFDEIAEITSRITEACHKYGMRVYEHHSANLISRHKDETYLGWNPEDSLVVDIRTGLPSRTDSRSNNRFVCINNPEFKEKFKKLPDRLGTQMKAVGEVMSIGKNYKEAFQKSIRSREDGRYGLGFARDYHARSLEELMVLLNEPSSERQFIMYEALRKGATVAALVEKTHIKAWFVEQMQQLVELEEQLLVYRGALPPDALLTQAKQDGFADRYLAQLLGLPEKTIRERRTAIGLVEGWHPVNVSGVENAAYYYSTYCAPDAIGASSNPKKVMILASSSITVACMPRWPCMTSVTRP